MMKLKKYKKRTMKNIPKSNANPHVGENTEIVLLDEDTNDSNPSGSLNTSSNGNTSSKGTPEVIDLDNYDILGKKKKKRSATNNCVNIECESGENLRPATIFCLNYYRIKIKPQKNQEICEECYDKSLLYYEELSNSIQTGDCLINQKLPTHDEYVEIDSDDSSDDILDICVSGVTSCKISDTLAGYLELELPEVLNDTVDKYDMKNQLQEATNKLRHRQESQQDAIDSLSALEKDFQVRLDKIRSGLYTEFQKKAEELPPLELDTVTPSSPSSPEKSLMTPMTVNQLPPSPRREAERRSHRNIAKPASYCEIIDDDAAPEVSTSVVTSTSGPGFTEIPPTTMPTNLPPSGKLFKARPQIGEVYLAMRQSIFGAWGKVKLLEIETVGSILANSGSATINPPEEETGGATGPANMVSLTNTLTLSGGNITATVPTVNAASSAASNASSLMYKVRFEGKKLTSTKYVTGKQLAYPFPASVKLEVGTRVIAVFCDEQSLKKESYYAGIIAEPLSVANHFRYLVFFDDGYAQYVHHNKVLVVCESSKNVWEDIHPDSQTFIKKYLETYPERPLVKVKPDQVVKTEWNGKWWIGRVLRVDCSLVHMYFDADNRSEWIYRGSTRLGPLFLEVQAAAARQEKGPHIPKFQQKSNKNSAEPYVEYPKPPEAEPVVGTIVGTLTPINTIPPVTAEPPAPRAVARKSTSRPPNTLPQSVNMVPFLPTHHVQQPQSKVVYFTPKSINPLKSFVPHVCSRECSKLVSLPLSALKGYNPLSKPLLIGWHRQLFKYRGKKGIRYRAPCGRTLRNMPELHKYLRLTNSEMSVDNFDFDFWVHTLAEFVLDKTFRSKRDISNGVENVPIPCVNYVDNSMPDFISYSTKREPKEGVRLNLDPEFLSCCDCTDDCSDKTKCACWQLTIREARTLNKRVPDELIGYSYKRLPDCVTTGIYECNSRCKCAKTCLNRVVQHPLQLKLQLFKTANRGWGIRCLNDIPHGAFICIYAGSLLTDKMANEGGVNYGDEYLAELDYIEVVERQKDGYESDVTDIESETSQKNTNNSDDSEYDEFDPKKFSDYSFKSNARVTTTSSVTTRSRQKTTQDNPSGDTTPSEQNSPKTGRSSPNSETVTISDDEETIREKSSFIPSTETEDQIPVSKFKSVRKMFGEDEVCYIMDAKNTGNIGRFLNHSCSPNVFVQNVFVDTHDLRFPWVAFFAMNYIRAGTELTWNYNYDVGSVPGKVIFCHCGSPDCRGRLL